MPLARRSEPSAAGEAGLQAHAAGDADDALAQAMARADGAVWIQIVSSAPGEQGYFPGPAQAKAWIAAQKAPRLIP